MRPRQTVLGVVLIAASVVAAATERATEVPARQQYLEEIQVEGKRLLDMRAAVIAAEDRFFDRYNELNKVDEFSIRCVKRVFTGSLLWRRICLVKAEEDAAADEAKAVLEMMQPENADTAPRVKGTPSEATRGAKAPVYEANMLALLNTNADLRRLMRERDALQKRYVEARQSRLKGKLFAVE